MRETPLGVKRVWLVKGAERRFRADIRIGDACALWRARLFCVLFCLLSIPKRNYPREGDTIRSQKSMVGKGEERRLQTGIRIGDLGARVRAWFL